MKVILLKDVARIGKRNQVVEVPNGFAMNRLIPQKMAEPATKANMKRIAEQSEKNEAEREADKERFQEALTSLQESPLVLTAEANEKGHLFKAVSKEEIAEEAKSKGIDLPVSSILFKDPIKDVGEHELLLSRGTETDTIVVTVEAAK